MFQQNYKNKYLKYKSKYLDLKYGGVFDLNELSEEEREYYDKLNKTDIGWFSNRIKSRIQLKKNLNQWTKKIEEDPKNSILYVIEINKIDKQLFKIEIELNYIIKNNIKDIYLNIESNLLLNLDFDIEVYKRILNNRSSKGPLDRYNLEIIKKIEDKEKEREQKIKEKEEEDEKQRIINNKKKNVMEFFKRLFNFLFYHNQCFFKGTLVFQDNNNKLYNFLTYGIISENESCFKDPIAQQKYSVKDYMEVYKKDQRIESSDKCFLQGLEQSLRGCTNNKCLILEIIFYEDLNYLCDNEKKESKQSCIYYKFKYENKHYIFLKLLPFPFNSIGYHTETVNKAVKGIYQFFGKKDDTLDRYHQRNHNNDFAEYKFNDIDNDFYKNLGIINNDYYLFNNTKNENIYNIYFKYNNDDYINDINYYNKHLRTGDEMFITEKLKNYFIFISESRTQEDIQKYLEVENPNFTSNTKDSKEKLVPDSSSSITTDFTTEETSSESEGSQRSQGLERSQGSQGRKNRNNRKKSKKSQ
jgi:hypothetical protein